MTTLDSITGIGINIIQRPIHTDHLEITARLLDFGGQEIMHAKLLASATGMLL